ncbi:MAG TPA: c-type cytochrome [Thermoanaerobaculia bacterium]|nr:c-type cytochrome [Thermoanaerobaculia bacterium]
MSARLSLLALFLLLFSFAAISDEPKDDPAVTDLLAAIKGKENQPAGEVFKNVKLLKDVPAARFLRMMDTGFSRALGVGCEHCHVEDRWEADEQRPKLAAREMMLMVREINDLLGKMQHIDNTEPAVNCTTCHRGYVKPALQMR